MDPGSQQEKELKAEFGLRLLDRYMRVLEDPNLWLDTAFCWRREHLPASTKQRKRMDPSLNFHQNMCSTCSHWGSKEGED